MVEAHATLRLAIASSFCGALNHALLADVSGSLWRRSSKPALCNRAPEFDPSNPLLVKFFQDSGDALGAPHSSQIAMAWKRSTVSKHFVCQFCRCIRDRHGIHWLCQCPSPSRSWIVSADLPLMPPHTSSGNQLKAQDMICLITADMPILQAIAATVKPRYPTPSAFGMVPTRAAVQGWGSNVASKMVF